MKKLLLIAVAALALPLVAVPAAHSTSHSASYKASGTVTKVDPKAGRVTIAHGPVEALKWPAMTMGFGVKDKTLLERAQPGKKVEFEFAKQGSDYVIVKIK